MKLKSYLEAINSEIVEFREEEIYSLYGTANVGKSLYLLGEVANALSQGIRVIWLDTEGGLDGLKNKFMPKLVDRFHVKPEQLAELKYRRIFDIEQLALEFGIKLNIEYGDKKAGIYIKDTHDKTENTILSEYGRKRGNIMLVIDSFSSPFKLEFTTNVENFSGRADAMSAVMLGIVKFMAKTKAFTVLTHHTSINPTNPYEVSGAMRGGNYCKIL